MFTGIVSGPYTVKSVEDHDGLRTFAVELPKEQLSTLEDGASVAIDGVCLTATNITDSSVSFDAMQQTLDVTTIGALQDGSEVNVERSFVTGQEVGGHIVSGHVDGLGEIVSIEQPANNYIMQVRLPEAQMPYIFVKGFLAVNGCSLTVAELDRESRVATFYLIPETMRQTTFGSKQVGDMLNIEVDRNTQTIVETVKSTLKAMAESGELSA